MAKGNNNKRGGNAIRRFFVFLGILTLIGIAGFVIIGIPYLTETRGAPSANTTTATANVANGNANTVIANANGNVANGGNTVNTNANGNGNGNGNMVNGENGMNGVNAANANGTNNASVEPFFVF